MNRNLENEMSGHVKGKSGSTSGSDGEQQGLASCDDVQRPGDVKM